MTDCYPLKAHLFFFCAEITVKGWCTASCDSRIKSHMNNSAALCGSEIQRRSDLIHHLCMVLHYRFIWMGGYATPSPPTHTCTHTHTHTEEEGKWNAGKEPHIIRWGHSHANNTLHNNGLFHRTDRTRVKVVALWTFCPWKSSIVVALHSCRLEGKWGI